MEMPKAAEAHRKLEILTGTWVGEEKISPTPWDPAGGTAEGRAVNRVALDGFAVVQDYDQKRGGHVTFRGHGVFRWDGMQNCYVMHWFDSMGMPPVEYRGGFRDNSLILSATAPQGQTRATWEFTGKDRHQFKMEVSPDGISWHPFMAGTYVRQ